MKRLSEMLGVVRFAVLSGAQDFASIYTWRTWLAGWYVRVLAQVIFFALIGRLIGSDERTKYLLLGNAVMIVAVEGIWSVNMVRWERSYGTLPLLVASPASPVLVFASRGLYLLADGIVSAISALVVAAVIFGLDLPWIRLPIVVVLLALTAASAYSFGTFLGGVIVRWRAGTNLIVNGAILTLMALGGVNVPIQFFPTPVGWIAEVLPLTHGLRAIRELLSNADVGAIILQTAAETAVAGGWMLLAVAVFARTVYSGRRDGSIEFAS